MASAPLTPFEVRRTANAHMGFRMVQVRALIADRIESTGARPSYREISEELGMYDKSNVGRIVRTLKGRGLLPNQ